MAASAAGLNHLISFPKKVQVHFGQDSLPYALHLNSANDILIKKEESWKLLDGDAKKRRQSSEKSISVLTNGDLRQKASGGKGQQKRNDRKKMSFRDVEEFE